MHKINEHGYVSFKESISDFFHGLIDFKGITTRRGYLFPLVYYYGILVTGVLSCMILIFFDDFNLVTLCLWIVIILNFISSNLLIIPVTVRRF